MQCSILLQAAEGVQHAVPQVHHTSPQHPSADPPEPPIVHTVDDDSGDDADVPMQEATAVLPASSRVHIDLRALRGTLKRAREQAHRASPFELHAPSVAISENFQEASLQVEGSPKQTPLLLLFLYFVLGLIAGRR